MKVAHVSIIMGSDSDLPVMSQAAEMLKYFGIPFELMLISAHRTPEKLYTYSREVHKRGVKVVIAGAGGAAHLPGMVASLSPLPVIGVPIKASNSLDGWDSILSILQMPNGIPVATVALNGAKNAAILAAQMIGASDKIIQDKVVEFKSETANEITRKNEHLMKIGYENYGKDTL
jgi:5-(carboxyamino)imidazole ribonucleotide mutase